MKALDTSTVMSPTKHHCKTPNTTRQPHMFSIIIPSYNNLPYLKICLGSIAKHSSFSHEIIVHVNEGSDGTLAYVREKGIKHSFSPNNVGMCTAVNTAAALATTTYILYCHDDMYVCPDWDRYLWEEVNKLGTNAFYLSGSMIEQHTGHIQLDCGADHNDFDEEKLLTCYHRIALDDHQGTHWAPHLIHKSYWDKVGGFSEAFNPGLGSDPDLNMKLWQAGVRVFKGLSACRVYHFGPTTLRTRAWNDGNKLFLLTWGMSIGFFKKHYLRYNQPYHGKLSEPRKTCVYYLRLMKCKITRKLLQHAIKWRLMAHPAASMPQSGTATNPSSMPSTSRP